MNKKENIWMKSSELLTFVVYCTLYVLVTQHMYILFSHVHISLNTLDCAYIRFIVVIE